MPRRYGALLGFSLALSLPAGTCEADAKVIRKARRASVNTPKMSASKATYQHAGRWPTLTFLPWGLSFCHPNQNLTYMVSATQLAVLHLLVFCDPTMVGTGYGKLTLTCSAQLAVTDLVCEYVGLPFVLTFVRVTTVPWGSVNEQL